jgi:hypothetical protein
VLLRVEAHGDLYGGVLEQSARVPLPGPADPTRR